jgi:hypothetical protein
VPAARGLGIELEVEVRNTGTARWLTAAGSGQVNLGVHVLDASGRLVDDNFARLRIPATAGAAVAPGESVRIRGTIALPGVDDFMLRLDMVAELVAWFSKRDASKAVTLRGREIAG